MTKIDIEKFIVEMLRQLMDGHPLKTNILYALLKQGLVYTDGRIMSTSEAMARPSSTLIEEAITNEPVIEQLKK